jgi:hypothetical protein
MDRILRVYPPAEPDRPDLEQLFTLLDLAALGVKPLLLSQVNWSDVRSRLMGMITWAFLRHEDKFQDEISSASVAGGSVFKKWTSFLARDDTIITFNWDIAHEAALWRCGKWHYADGYGFACEGAPDGVSSAIKVLKLHGSVNWAQGDKDDCEPSIEHRASFFRGATDPSGPHTKSASWNQGRNLIVPTYLKDITNSRLLLKLWIQAGEALSKANEVTVIGLSLHPADAMARFLIASALQKNPNDFTVQVVSPDGLGHWDEFCDSIRRPRSLIRKRFEEWVLRA